MILVPSELHIQLVFPAFSCRPHLFTNTVRSRSLRDHTFKKLIKITILVREGVWGLIFEFEGTSGGPCRELFFEFESPPVNAACSLLLLFVMAEAVAEAEAVADAAKCSEAGKARLEPYFNFHPQNHYR